MPRFPDFVPVKISSVPTVSSLKLLGVVFDSKCGWSSHTDHTVKRASRNLFLVRMLKQNLSPESLMTVYFSIVRSILEYCSPLFVGLDKSSSDKLERVQRRFHRILCGKNCVSYI